MTRLLFRSPSVQLSRRVLCRKRVRINAHVCVCAIATRNGDILSTCFACQFLIDFSGQLFVEAEDPDGHITFITRYDAKKLAMMMNECTDVE